MMSTVVDYGFNLKVKSIKNFLRSFFRVLAPLLGIHLFDGLVGRTEMHRFVIAGGHASPIRGCHGGYLPSHAP